jgi:hypothetical protein
MSQLILPRAHTEADLVLAGQIAELIDSAELYVSWTPEQGRAVPEVMAELRAAVPRWSGTVALLLEAARDLWGALRGRRPQPRALPPAAERPAQPKPAA